MIIGTVQQQEIMQHATLTEEEARQYYDAHPEEFMTPATVTLREMLVAVPTDNARRPGTSFSVGADDDGARTRSTTRVRALVKGEDFATVAGEVSDSGSKANGGLIGAGQRSIEIESDAARA